MRIPTIDAVAIFRRGTSGTAGYSGLTRCGSVWGCAFCAARIAAERQQIIETGMATAIAEGASVAMVALTFPHRKTDDLQSIYTNFRAAVQQMRKGASWKRFRDRWGVIGDIQTTEATWGEANGWHPHRHWTMPVTNAGERDVEPMKQELHRLWARACVKHGLPKPSYAHGVDVSIRSGAKAAEAAAKYATHTASEAAATAAWEATGQASQSDATKAKKAGRYTYWQIMDVCAELERQGKRRTKAWKRWAGLAREYVAVFSGTQHHRWSRGLKERLGVHDAADQELAEREAESNEVMAVIEPKAWKKLDRTESSYDLIRVAETQGVEGVVKWCEARGIRIAHPQSAPWTWQEPGHQWHARQDTQHLFRDNPAGEKPAKSRSRGEARENRPNPEAYKRIRVMLTHEGAAAMGMQPGQILGGREALAVPPAPAGVEYGRWQVSGQERGRHRSEDVPANIAKRGNPGKPSALPWTRGTVFVDQKTLKAVDAAIAQSVSGQGGTQPQSGE